MFVSGITLGAGLLLIEKYYRYQLDKMGWLPKNTTNNNLYDRRISGYTVRENTPNYKLDAYDENFHQTEQLTDSNGFITGGPDLKKEKDSNTIRIFITGGSAAWGSIESCNMMHDNTYPSGTYCYRASIAGKLKRLLTQKYPGTNFEVINAAVVAFRFHQSLALYFERLHDFKPDVIINIDGFNDMSNLVAIQGGDPYPSVVDQLEEEIQIATMARLPERPYALAYYNLKHIKQQKLRTKMSFPAKDAISNDETVINHELNEKAFELVKPYLHVSDKMLWLISSYERQLKTDGVYSIFCLQPTLRRRGYQKELSPTELRLRASLEKVTVADTINTRLAINSDKGLLLLYATIEPIIHQGVYWMPDMLSAYVFNQLSPVLDSTVSSNGGTYLDINKEMTGIKSEEEFYVDYCHLTPYGNEFVAEMLADKVDSFMKQRFKNHS